MMALAVLFIWSMASSSDVMRSWMSLRSNGVMKVRRTAVSTWRVTSSAAASCIADLLAVAGDAVAAREQPAQRLGAGEHDGGVLGEQVEEAVLPRHQRLEPAQHFGLSGQGVRRDRRPAGAILERQEGRKAARRSLLPPGRRAALSIRKPRREWLVRLSRLSRRLRSRRPGAPSFNPLREREWRSKASTC